MTSGRRTALDMVAAWARHLASAVAGLVTVWLVSRRLGPEGLGAWALLGTASHLLGLCDLGLATAIQRAAAAGDAARTRRAVALALKVAAVLAPLLALGCAPLLLELPGASPQLLAQLPEAAAVALAAGVLQAFAQPFRAFALIRGGMLALARARLAGVLAQVGVTVAVLWTGPTLLGPACGLLAGALAELTLSRRAARAIDPQLTADAGAMGRPELVAALRDGAASLTTNLAVAAMVRLDFFVLTRFSPLAAVAGYAVASRAVDQSLGLAKQAGAALLPRLADRDGRDRAVALGTAVFGGLVASGMAALVLDGSGLLVAWAGEAAAGPVAAQALALLGATAVLVAAAEMPSSALTLAGRTAWAAAIPIVLGAAVKLAVVVAAAGRAGPWVVAGGTLAAQGVVCVLVWRRAALVLGWRAGRIALALAPAAAAGCVALAAGALLLPLARSSTAGSAAACVLATGLGCGAAALVARRTLRTPAAVAGADGAETRSAAPGPAA